MLFPDMPCMKKVYRDKKASVGPLVSSQEQRGLLIRPGDKPQINRLSTTVQPFVVFLSSIGLNMISLVRASGGMFRRRFLEALGGTKDARFLGELFCRRPDLPGPAPPPRRAPRSDPPVVCPGFGLCTFFPDMPCMKKAYRDKKASVHWSAAGNEERPSSRG